MKLAILEVYWEDITEVSGWYPKAVPVEQYIQPASIITIGFKIKETKRYIYLSPMSGAMGPDDNWGSVIVIPKGCIKKKRIIGYRQCPGTKLKSC